jgi:hypothetical protein
MCRYARPLHFGDGLPDGACDLRQLPDGVDDKVIAELIKVERLAPAQKLTPRERMRALRKKESVDKPCFAEPADGDSVAELLLSTSQMSGVAFGDAIATHYQLTAVIDEVDSEPR